MNNFEYNNPTKIIFGKNTIAQIGRELSQHHISKVLFLAGGGSIQQNGVYTQVVNSLRKYKIEFKEYFGVKANPEVQHARGAVDIIKSEGLQAVLAVGGGSVIDEAKAIAAGVHAEDIWNLYTKSELIGSALPIFTVLTISGTGSEMNQNSVLTNPFTQQKYAMGSRLLYPKVSIIDPSVQMSLPWNQTVNGGIDAMSHVMEYYFLAERSNLTTKIDESLLVSLMVSLDKLQSDPYDYTARASLAWAATLALNGISGAGIGGGDWASHRIEHALSAFDSKISHGAGLAVIFPAWISYVAHHLPERFAEWAKNVWNCDSVESAVRAMKAKYASWNAPVSLDELGIAETDHEWLADNALFNGSVGNLVSLSEEDIISILRLAQKKN